MASRPPSISTVVGCCSAWSCASPTRRTADVLLCGYRAIQRGWHACRYRRATEHDSGRGGRSRELETQQVPTHGCSDYGRVGSPSLFAGLLPHPPPLLTRCREGNALWALSTLSLPVGRAPSPPSPLLTAAGAHSRVISSRCMG